MSEQQDPMDGSDRGVALNRVVWKLAEALGQVPDGSEKINVEISEVVNAACAAIATWQPIESAPRDATAILVMRDIWPGTDSGRAEECNGHNTYVAAWWTDRWVCYMDVPDDPHCPIDPTHWMPLPPPPAA